MINQVTLVGRVGTEPESRTFPNGSQTCSFSLATSEYWKDKTTGERKDKTQWHRIGIYTDKTIEIAMKYVQKGDLIGIQGQLEHRDYKDKQGNERKWTEVALRFNGKIHLFPKSHKGNNNGNQEQDWRNPPNQQSNQQGRDSGSSSWRPSTEQNKYEGNHQGIPTDEDDNIPF